MSTLAWSAELALDQPRMDATHQEFVDLLAELEATLDGDRAEVDAALASLVDHTVGHFDQEEVWMGALGFATENCHAFQHQAVLNVLREVQRLHAAEGDRDLVRRLAGELAQWFPAHAQMMDAALAQTMAERGFDPETGQVAVPAPADAQPITGCGGASCS
jgi:hemerythrin-like metal-binding protein